MASQEEINAVFNHAIENFTDENGNETHPWFYHDGELTWFFLFEIHRILSQMAYREGQPEKAKKAWPARKALYKSYLQSDQWKAIAESVKERFGYRCQICNRHKSEAQIDAHHRTYDRLGMESWEDLTVLCNGCHRLYHGILPEYY